MDLITEASRHLRRVVVSKMSRPVEYCWSNGDRCELRARPRDQRYEVASETGNVLGFESRDYVFPAKDLIRPGFGQIVPQPGDHVEETINGVLYRFEVALQGQEKCFEYLDQENAWIQVHTKKVRGT